MLVGDVFELKVSQFVPNIGDEVLNVYFYKLMTGTFVLDDFIGLFVLNVILPLRNMQSSQLAYRTFTLSNIFNLDEFFVRSYNDYDLAGLIISPTAPPSTAVNFTLHRSSRTVRNGSKRIGGLPNNVVTEGRIVDGFILTQMATVAAAMSEELTEPISGAVLRPCIVGRVKTPNPDYPADSKYEFKYALPEAQGDSPVVEVAQTTFSAFTSTQVTRKTNR